MATLFDFHNARIGFTTDVGIDPGALQKLFVNRLSSIVKNTIRDSNSNEIDNFRCNYLLSEITSKSPIGQFSLPEGQRDKLAIAKTMTSNDHCKSFNERTPPEFSNWSVLVRARAIIYRILGEFDYGIYNLSGFSSGASTSHKRGRSDPFSKYGSLDGGCIEVTPRAYSRLCALVENTPTMKRQYYASLIDGHDSIQITQRDVVKTVPKNSKISRTILIQPAGNNILQKAIGKAIRRKLKAVGVNLSDQTLNQQLARVGSQYRSHATIDLSSASDTVNYRIVWELLPPNWFRELEALRCDYGSIKDTSGKTLDVVKWQMFSAMGNAFTFELESLIFYAIAVATAEEQGSYVGCINVFGDDIIVPNSVAPIVCENLQKCGFIINNDKTHIDGWFRESCGAHWYRGVCVKPFYIRSDLTELSAIMRLANQLRKWSSDGIVCDPRFQKLWMFVASHVPKIFWGGWDLERSDSLVSPHRPNKKLVPVTGRAQIGGEGALAAAFQATADQLPLHEYTHFTFSELDDTIGVGHGYWVKTDENRFWIRRNRDYGRLTSPPVWVVSMTHEGSNTLVEHLYI